VPRRLVQGSSIGRGCQSRGRLHAETGTRCAASTVSKTILNDWIAAACIGKDKKGPLFRSFKKGDKLTQEGHPQDGPLHPHAEVSGAENAPPDRSEGRHRHPGGSEVQHCQTRANGAPQFRTGPARMGDEPCGTLGCRPCHRAGPDMSRLGNTRAARSFHRRLEVGEFDFARQNAIRRGECGELSGRSLLSH
jgi:hypothetical protein